MLIETKYYQLKMLFRLRCKNRKIKVDCELGKAIRDKDFAKAEIMMINWLVLFSNLYPSLCKEYNLK